MAEQPEASLRPNFAVLIAGTGAAACLSFTFLLWPLSLLSTMLVALMIAGADVDARALLLPDVVTYGAIILGILAAPLLGPGGPWLSIASSVGRAAGTALLLALLRSIYARVRGQEGLGFGDVKLAGAVGAWLPLEAIPYCFSLATTAAMVSLAFKWREATSGKFKLPFGAFLCPSLWFVFFLSSLP